MKLNFSEIINKESCVIMLDGKGMVQIVTMDKDYYFPDIVDKLKETGYTKGIVAGHSESNWRIHYTDDELDVDNIEYIG